MGSVLNQWSYLIDGKIRTVKTLAQLYVLQKKATSLNNVLSEFRDGEGHCAIHFAANRGYNDICEWILETVPECVLCAFVV